MMSLLAAVGRNNILWASFFAWAIAQTIKVFLGVIKTKKFDFRWFVGTGGMPSAHSSGVVCLATTVGLRMGFSSAIFAVTAVFTAITMFDAQGVRRAVGRQAEIMNKMLSDIYIEHRVKEDRLKELLGHTPLEVLMGAIMGILLALLFYMPR